MGTKGGIRKVRCQHCGKARGSTNQFGAKWLCVECVEGLLAQNAGLREALGKIEVHECGGHRAMYGTEEGLETGWTTCHQCIFKQTIAQSALKEGKA